MAGRQHADTPIPRPTDEPARAAALAVLARLLGRSAARAWLAQVEGDGPTVEAELPVPQVSVEIQE